MKVLTLLLLILSLQSLPTPSEVGYRVSGVQKYLLLRETSTTKSKLYEIVAPELDDDRPMKLLYLEGDSFNVGKDYVNLLHEEIVTGYHKFFTYVIKNKTVLQIIQAFLDWQYEFYVGKNIPLEFVDELKGITAEGYNKGQPLIGTYFKRILVVSSFPGALQHDVMAILFDQFLRDVLMLKNQKLQSFVQDNLLFIIKEISNFIEKHSVMCSFFGVWGSRTQKGQLYTMRNLDWMQNSGVNTNKLIIVWKKHNRNPKDKIIPHATLGYPGMMGALTGISAAGITVHQAGQSSRHGTEIGFQWSLRMRYIMQYAHNISSAVKLWKQANNTLGMNYMIGSAQDQQSIVLETMRGYTAYFMDHDVREDGTIFVEKNGHQYQAGYSMQQALFRTNHAYDPKIKKHSRVSQIEEEDNSMRRYFILKDSFHYYEEKSIAIAETQALNITATLGDKGGEIFHTCENNTYGRNVISVTYKPQQLMMWVSFEYGQNNQDQQTFRTASCGVYVQMDMKQWLGTQYQ